MIAVERPKQTVRGATLLALFCLTLPTRWAVAGEPAPVGSVNAPPTVRAPAAQGESSPQPIPSSLPAPVASAAPHPPAWALIAIDPMTLEGPSFYDAVGRPDLANSYRNRRTMKTASRVVGGLVLGVGMLGLLGTLFLDATAHILNCPTAPSGTNCVEDHSGGPLALMGVGTAMLVVPAFVPNEPASWSEKEALVKEVIRRNQARGGPVSLNLGVAPTPAGGGLMLLAGRY